MDLKGIAAAIATISIFGFGESITFPLFPVLLERMGATGAMIGVNAAAPAIDLLAATPFMPRLARRMGLSAFMIAGCLSAAAIMPLYKATSDPNLWIGLRTVHGALVAALFYGSEAWITAAAAGPARGRVIAAYALLLSLGFLAGPLAVAVTGVDGWTPFLAASAMVALAAAPVAWAAGRAPDIAKDADQRRGSIFRFFRSDPTLLYAVALFGAVEFGALALLPAWGLRVGLDEGGAVGLVALAAAGAVMSQLPLGWAADRFNRRGLLIISAASCAIAGALTPAVAGGGPALWTLMIFWGGLSVALYTVALTEIGARYSGATLSDANAAVILAYGLGSLAAPPLMGWAMDHVARPHGAGLTMAAMACAYIALASTRRVRNA